MRVLLRAALSRPVATVAWRIALVVGTVLNLINQGPEIYAGGEPSWAHITLNYLVPYCVASYSGATMHVRRGGTP